MNTTHNWLVLVIMMIAIVFGTWMILNDGIGEEAEEREAMVADEPATMNASNEEQFGIESSYTISVPGGGIREATAEEIYQAQASDIELSFDHVAPGQYSEVYASVTGMPGESYTVTLSGPGVTNPEPKEVVIGEEGYTRVTWRITQYGTYTAVSRFSASDSELFKKEATIVVN